MVVVGSCFMIGMVELRLFEAAEDNEWSRSMMLSVVVDWWLPPLMLLVSDGKESDEFLALDEKPPIGRVLLAMLFTSYRLMSKLVTALNPLNFMAAISYASAASS